MTPQTGLDYIPSTDPTRYGLPINGVMVNDNTLSHVYVPMTTNSDTSSFESFDSANFEDV